jgi:hypothetical protein
MISRAMTRLAFALALAGAALAGGRGLAHAHGPDAIFDPLTMDRHTPVSKLDFDFAYVVYEEPQGVDLTVIGFALSGQYVSPTGLGGYLSIPLSYIDLESPFDLLLPDDSELALGNVELGGLWSKYVTAHAAVVLRAGVALPTAADEDAAAFQLLASSPRYGDFVQRATNSTWLRLGVSPMGRVGDKLFWRVDVGMDLALDEDEATTYSPVFHLGFGGGIDLGSAHLQVELVTTMVDDDDADNNDDETASTFAFGARFLSGNLRPGIALLLPLGFNENALFDPEFSIVASLAARL